MTDLMLKDLGLSMDAAAETNAAVFMGALARNIFLNYSQIGHEKINFRSIFKFIAKIAETEQ